MANALLPATRVSVDHLETPDGQIFVVVTQFDIEPPRDISFHIDCSDVVCKWLHAAVLGEGTRSEFINVKVLPTGLIQAWEHHAKPEASIVFAPEQVPEICADIRGIRNHFRGS